MNYFPDRFEQSSESMREVMEQVSQLGQEIHSGKSHFALFIGEKGTGKESLARLAIKRGFGENPKFIRIDCRSMADSEGALDRYLHSSGNPDQTVLFLKEVGEGSLRLQNSLLSLLHSDHPSVCVIASSSGDLELQVKQKTFLASLYLILASKKITAPALRERSEDILILAEQHLKEDFALYKKEFGGFNDEAKNALKSYFWPGNVRELFLMLEKIALHWDKGDTATPVTLEDLPIISHLGSVEKVRPLWLYSDHATRYTELKKKWSESFEKEYISEMLTRHHGNVSAAAREMKLDRSNFLRLLRKYGIRSEVFRSVA